MMRRLLAAATLCLLWLSNSAFAQEFNRSSLPIQPFFMYWAPGASHGPHQVTKEWADKYKGKFDDGWDRYRERVFANQKRLGWIPKDAKLTPRAESMASWDSIPESEKPFQRRLMEVFAGFTEHADYNAGRVIAEIEKQGQPGCLSKRLVRQCSGAARAMGRRHPARHPAVVPADRYLGAVPHRRGLEPGKRSCDQRT